MNEDILLALGDALVRTVRHKVRYSENSPLLYDGYSSSSYFHHRRQAVNDLRFFFPVDGGQRGKNALKKGVGFCEDLCRAIFYITGLLQVDLEKSVYINMLKTTSKEGQCHVFCLLHTAKDHIIHLNDDWPNDFEQLSQKGDLSNAVIVDPWIYKASKLSDFRRHIEQASFYGVESYYDIREMSSIGHRLSTFSYSGRLSDRDEVELVRTFDQFYHDGVEKMNIGDLSYFSGQSVESVREQLIQEIVQQEKIDSLFLFINRIASNLKTSYFDGQRQERTVCDQFMRFLERKRGTYEEVTENELKVIFYKTLHLALPVREQGMRYWYQTFFSMMDTPVLFRPGVIGDGAYHFEVISGMSLNTLRNILHSTALSKREKYTSLCEYATEVEKQVACFQSSHYQSAHIAVSTRMHSSVPTIEIS